MTNSSDSNLSVVALLLSKFYLFCTRASEEIAIGFWIHSSSLRVSRFCWRVACTS
jgi:hypothetical protein